MVRLPLEYSLCQIQSGQISLARKTHRRENGNPEIDIMVRPNDVLFRLLNLVDGVPQAVLDEPRQDHVDFYFLWDQLQAVRGQFPAVPEPANNGLFLQTFDPSGTERAGGRQVRMVTPICRMAVNEVRLESYHDPVFRAIGDDPHFFIDFEITPVRNYGEERAEIHFGINATFELVDSEGVNQDVCDITMPRETYATIRDRVMGL